MLGRQPQKYRTGNIPGGLKYEFTRDALFDEDRNELIVLGETYSFDFPGRSGGAQASNMGRSEVFISRLNADLARLRGAIAHGCSR